ncbi:unnamed protein product, partial [Scytosiphon promiscuus]
YRLSSLTATSFNAFFKHLHQVSDRSLESAILAEVFMATIKEPFYDTLRTKKQLGYTVFCSNRVEEGVSMMHFVIQSPERSPAYLTERCLECLREFRQQLVDMTSSKVSAYIQGLVSRILEPDRSLLSEASRNWNEITTGQLDFDRRRQEVEALQKIDGETLLQFFDRHITEGGNERRVLTSEVYANKFASDMDL